MFALLTSIQGAVCIALPVLLVRALRRRWPVSWATIGAGVAAFLASQLVHLPLNHALLPRLPGSEHPYHLAVVATALGLSAALCEETARYVALRFTRPLDRTGPDALAFGAGHGGVESAIVGALALSAAFDLLYIHRVGLGNLGLDPAQQHFVASQLSAIDRMPTYAPLLGVVERLGTLPFHLAASCLVMRSVATSRFAYYALAVAFHALSDGVLVLVSVKLGLVAAEVWVLLTLPLSLLAIALCLRALPAKERVSRGERPTSEGAPIELADVEKVFGEGASVVKAVDGIRFVLRPGERCCLLGPNGAGKTTSIRMITGALTPTRGFAFVYGSTAEDDAFLEQKRRVGIVPQQPGMYPELSVRDYLDLVRDLYGGEVDRAALTARLGLADVLDRPTSALSGGMQRRLALAAALLPQPELLVLDEPSAGLDPVAAREMIACVKDASEGRTTLLCTHNLAEAEELCDSVVILRSGKVLIHAPIAELKRSVRPLVSLRSSGPKDALREVLRAAGHAPLEDGDEVRVATDDVERAVPALLRALLDAGVPVLECRVLHPTLEDVFFRFIDARDSNPGGGR